MNLNSTYGAAYSFIMKVWYQNSNTLMIFSDQPGQIHKTKLILFL